MVAEERDTQSPANSVQGSLEQNTAWRRSSLIRMINDTRKGTLALKIYAAQRIRYFVKEFPDLQEDIFDAVFNLCEDQESRVRLAGYQAVVAVSREQPEAMKRNADVLVQLLQSEEPEEVAVVKNAILAHLEMDSLLTLGVLCDQIILPEGVMDDEEQTTRERLRSLVLAFLLGEAKHAIASYTDPPGNDSEAVLVFGLIKAVDQVGLSELNFIIQDLLLGFPAFKAPSERGSQLIAAILRRSQVAIAEDVPTAVSYLALTHTLVVDQPIALPADLLTFYRDHVLKADVLQRFSAEDRLLVVCYIAEALAKDNTPDNRATVAPAIDVILSALRACHASRHIAACLTILHACAGNLWTPSSSAIESIRAISLSLKAGEKTRVEEDVQSLQATIRTILAPPPSPLQPLSTATTSGNKSMATTNNTQYRQGPKARPREDDEPPPPRPTKKAKKAHANVSSPSLLSRLGNNERPSKPSPGAVGFSIKGAASREGNGVAPSQKEGSALNPSRGKRRRKGGQGAVNP